MWLRTFCASRGLQIGDEKLDLLARYVTLLLEWNKSINLISRRDEENVWRQHILHSISPLFGIAFPVGCRIIDLGTGGGLPGIPLKILNDSVQMVLLDATRKKVGAVEQIVKKLGLLKTTVVWGRAEEVGRKLGFKEAFDVVLARGVGPLPELVRLASPFLAVSSRLGHQSGKKNYVPIPCLLAYKGGDIRNELEKARRNAKVKNMSDISLQKADDTGEWIDKKLIIIHF
ncbi:MAG: 16S rRNA (guanine(527)-N(7))-methyltransferase RsmG [Ignavibacteriales bacterium]|nr:16S rRNA (guanine(527)-N(7))-methyltransferase RsmG [Ignavibacteriales bacterium]